MGLERIASSTVSVVSIGLSGELNEFCRNACPCCPQYTCELVGYGPEKHSAADSPEPARFEVWGNKSEIRLLDLLPRPRPQRLAPFTMADYEHLLRKPELHLSTYYPTPPVGVELCEGCGLKGASPLPPSSPHADPCPFDHRCATGSSVYWLRVPELTPALQTFKQTPRSSSARGATTSGSALQSVP
jgi:hypothetical protein